MKHLSRNLLLSGIVFMFGSELNNLRAGNDKSDTSNRAKEQPNVIMFITDDLGDWVSPLGYKQVKTLNLDRLASSGVLFRNAHAPGVFSAPSRTAIFTGMFPTTTGCYAENVFFYDHPEIVSIQMAFNNAGYDAYGAGKVYHHSSGFLDLRGWKEYYTRSQEVKDMGYQMNSYHQHDVPLPDPFPYSPYGRIHNPNGGSSLHLEYGPIPNDKEEDMADVKRTNWVCDVVKQKHDKPFFIALGMYLPHYPNYAPQKYFDLYDPEKLELPPYKEDDLDDLSPAIQKFYQSRSKQQKDLIKLGVLKETIRGQLVCISFADAMLGRVLDALEASPYKDNTIIVFWSDQGFHHGEKGHWGKHTLWQRTTQVPFIWAGPGIPKNQQVKTTVSLMDIYPTLTDLCNLQSNPKLEGVSLAPVLHDPSSAVDRNVFVPSHIRGDYAVINNKWRYISYNDGYEELYNENDDPNEWYNLIGNPKYAHVISEMKKSAPTEFAPSATPTKDMKLVIEGDKFHWEKKKSKN